MKKAETVRYLVKKAERSFEVAKQLFSEGHYDFSISRAYYAMFYCAEALLFTRDMSFSKHSAVISAFGKEFVRTGIFQKELQKNFFKAFEERLKGDYEISLAPSKEECEEVLKNAEEFLEETRKYLGIE